MKTAAIYLGTGEGEREIKVMKLIFDDRKCDKTNREGDARICSLHKIASFGIYLKVDVLNHRLNCCVTSNNCDLQLANLIRDINSIKTV